MAGKRAAASDLNHDNWDEADQPEESGVFRTASKEELQRRVIRTGRRRVQPGSATQDKKSVFSGFSGFNKAPTSSFDFLSNLTNGGGSTAPNGTSAEKKDTGSPTGMFGSPVASSTALFSTSPVASVASKPGTLFGSHQTSGDSKSTSIFGTASPTTASPGSTPTMNFGVPQNSTIPALNDPKPASIFGTSSQTSSVFDSSSKPTSTIKVQSAAPMFSMQPQGVTSVSKPSKPAASQIPGFQMPSVSTPSSAIGSVFNTTTNVNSSVNVTPEAATKTNSADQGKIDNIKYYSKIKALNECVSDWIKQNVNDNPLCILTPIFRDYEKYLQEIEDEHSANKEKTKNDNKTVTTEENKNCLDERNNISDKTTSTSSFPLASNSTATFATKPSAGFSLSTGPSPAPFSFGISTASPATAASSTVSTTVPTIPATSPFSFGIGKGFTFNSNVNQKSQEQAEEKKEGEDEDEPPKVEFTAIAEDNSIFDKRCKIFFKKDNNFVDKGVGTLYIKTIENSNKHQLIVRANTSLGTVLLNFILSESIPTQRMGKNNVMMVCIPTPDSKPPPIPVLIRVKSGEEADEMLNTLNKYKS